MTTNNLYAQLPAIIAHRGASARAPENTLAAFRQAAQLGATWLELDITISSDGIAIVFHDAELERCSNGQGLITQHTLAELQQLDFGSWFGAEFAGEPVLTLEALLAFANQHALGLNIEIKPTLGQENETLAAIAQALAAVPAQVPILFSSFNPYALAAARTQLPHYPRALCSEAIPKDWQARLQALDAVGLHFQAEFYDSQAIQPLLAAGIGLAVFTVNDKALALKMRAEGIHALFSDYPDLLSA